MLKVKKHSSHFGNFEQVISHFANFEQVIIKIVILLTLNKSKNFVVILQTLNKSKNLTAKLPWEKPDV